MSSPLAIDVADLSKKYGQRMALSHANFEVPMEVFAALSALMVRVKLQQ